MPSPGLCLSYQVLTILKSLLVSRRYALKCWRMRCARAEASAPELSSFEHGAISNPAATLTSGMCARRASPKQLRQGG
jgi:hypothetical protein